MLLKKILIWTAAVILTLGASVYQRMTGPTYPLDLEAELAGEMYDFELTRSATVTEGCRVEIPAHRGFDNAILVYRRYPGDFKADTIQLERTDSVWHASLPVQPVAGKLKYYLVLYKNSGVVYHNQDDAAIIRYKGDVPLWALIPHVIAMFGAMLLSTATLLMAITRIGDFRKTAFWTFGILVIGGFIFGPVVQYYAFGEAWTGWPVGKDLTDNKMLIAGIFWLMAVLLNLKKARRWAVILASVVLLGIFTIPHSARGSEFDYEKQTIKTGK